jgi:curved DNA-binding protein CbpA
VPDYYELLQISPNADPDMIHRVYRLLAQRYHPDNTASGDEKAFRAITDAYEVLSQPEKRAAYDVHLHSYRQVRWRIFDQRQAAVGKLAERSKRKGILDLLYTHRCNEPEKPSMNLHELEDLLGCPREHLEFSLWYLKEQGLVAKMDNGRFAVTAKGVDWAEQEEASARLREDRLLPAVREARG